MTPAESPPWLAVRVEQAANPNAVVAALFKAGSRAVHEDGATLVTHFPPLTDPSVIESLVAAADPHARVLTSDAPAMDWSEWRASVRAHRLGILTIAPPWLADRADPMTVAIDPAMAFGTGEHATTRGVVRLMQQLPSIPAVVADIGAGSAVLSICAARLGARKVVAIELDPDAIGNAERNVEENRVADRVHIVEGDAAVLLPLVAPVGLVLANIISSVLVGMLPVIHSSLEPRGSAILSGILRDEKVSMLRAIESGQWRVVSEDEEDEWWSVLIERLQ